MGDDTLGGRAAFVTGGGTAFLLSDDAAFVTGQCICVDGGLSRRGLPEPEHGRSLRTMIPDFFADGEP